MGGGNRGAAQAQHLQDLKLTIDGTWTVISYSLAAATFASCHILSHGPWLAMGFETARARAHQAEICPRKWVDRAGRLLTAVRLN